MKWDPHDRDYYVIGKKIKVKIDVSQNKLKKPKLKGSGKGIDIIPSMAAIITPSVVVNYRIVDKARICV